VLLRYALRSNSAVLLEIVERCHEIGSLLITSQPPTKIRGKRPGIRRTTGRPPHCQRRSRCAHCRANTSWLAGIAGEAAEKAARDVAVEAEQAARDAEIARQAAHDVALQAERKAARDARYAARKARPRK
jgi:hypothetical protein